MVELRQMWLRIGQERDSRFALPLYLLIPLVMVTAFATLSVAAQTLGSFTRPTPDPFETYITVFPGQPREALVTHGFSCPASHIGSYHKSTPETCVLWPASDLFSQVRVIVSQDTIQRIEFVLHEDQLRMVDLVARWGQPERTARRSVRQFVWTRNGYRTEAVAVVSRDSVLSPLHSVAIANTR